jgi:hypothetical protein
MKNDTKPALPEAENGNKSKPLLQAVFFAPYLPYSVKIAYDYFGDTQEIATLIGVEDRNGETRLQINTGGSALLKYCKLVLKPFSDYTEILEITDEMNDYEIQMIEDNPDLIKRLPYDVVEKMFKNHIDVFGLINFGLAVSIHDVV